MALNGKRKAAALLMNLDSTSAAELLKGLPVEQVEKIAFELAQLEASDQQEAKSQEKVVAEFFQGLQQMQNRKFNVAAFLNDSLSNIVGQAKAEEILSRIKTQSKRTDPFIPIRSATNDELTLALHNEHPQTIAVVLSELLPERSQQVLALLDDTKRLQAVRRMTSLEAIGPEIKQRIASVVTERLKSYQGHTLPEKREQTLRKLALILSGVEKEMRDALLEEIEKHDEETCKMIRTLMVTWEDIPTIADRSLQEALRAVDVPKLAVALFGADEEIAQKIRSNISERATARLDEEASLMQEPLPKEVMAAREEVVKPLREANEEGTLRFVQR